MSDDHLIMSRFENKISKCKTPLDLDKLCQTYLEFRGKYNSQPMDPWLEMMLKTNVKSYTESSDIKGFSVTKTIDEFEWSSMDIMTQSKYKNHFEIEMARDLGIECMRTGFIKIHKDYCVATGRHWFKAQIEVVKPKETK